MSKQPLPKRLPCKCGNKPKLIIEALGFSDKDDCYTLQCKKCGIRIEADYNLRPEFQEFDVVEKWNLINTNKS